MRSVFSFFCVLGCAVLWNCSKNTNADHRKPNIIYILADDLGYHELGCYGQQKIKTPHIDQLAVEGMRFTQHYSGSTVCAPSRCVLLTGKHTGHAYVRGNYELGGFLDEEEGGQLPLPPGTPTLASLLKAQGYATGAIGKWGLGGPGSTGIPNQQGFDFFYGYLCQKQAHNYYPTHLWKNDVWDTLDNEFVYPHQSLEGDTEDPASYEKFTGKEYAVDKMEEEALQFIRNHQEEPFFLYLPFPIPHVSLQVPATTLAQYAGAFPETPYLGQNNYLPHPTPRAAYAAMITHMDQKVGEIMQLLQTLGIDEHTLVLFSSDNGTTFNGGTDAEFFNSTGALRGLKTSLYEGGIRVPMIARWPGKIAPGTTTDHISAFWDVLPTIMEVVESPVPAEVDGISFLPTLVGKGGQPKHRGLYWEFHERWGGAQAVRMGPWKGIRMGLQNEPNPPLALYNLETDIGETTDVSADHPEVVQQMLQFIQEERIPSSLPAWKFAEDP